MADTEVDYEVRVLDGEGRIVAEAHDANDARFALHYLPPGLYAIVVAADGLVVDKASVDRHAGDYAAGLVEIHCGLDRKRWHYASTPMARDEPPPDWWSRRARLATTPGGPGRP